MPKTSTGRTFGAVRKLPSGRFQASYSGPDGRRHTGWETFTIRGDAERWLRDEQVMIERGEWTSPARRSPFKRVDGQTMAEYAEVVLRRRQTRARKPIKRTTADLYRKLLRLCILPRFGRVAVADITRADVIAWHDSLSDSHPTQRGNAYQLLHSILAEAVEDDLIDANPCRIKGAGKPEPAHEGIALTPTQLARYAAALPPWARGPLLLAAWCGLRSGEARALRLRDISPDGSTIRVERTVSRVKDPETGVWSWHFDTPKTAAGRRVVAVPPHVQPILKAHLEACVGRGPDRLAFPAFDGYSPINSSTLYAPHARAAEKIGVPGLRIHDLRRTGATLAGQSGATIKELMRFLGHKQPEVAMVYQVADDERDKLRAERMTELTRGTG